MNINLELRYSEHPRRTASAWWLAGDSASAWLSEVATWPTSHGTLRFYRVPRLTEGQPEPTQNQPSLSASLGDGILAVPASNDASRVEAIHPAGIPFGQIGKRLFLPINATFSPYLADSEIADLLPPDSAIYIWHPSGGLVRCDETSTFRCGQWLQLPPRDDITWNKGVPGTTLNTRLVSIASAMEFNVESIMEQAREDIGSRADSLKTLPSVPGEMSAFRLYLPKILLGLAVFTIVVVVIALLWLMFSGSDMDGVASLLPFLLMVAFIIGLMVASIIGLLALANKYGGAVSAARNASSQGRTPGQASGGSSGNPSGSSWFQGVRQWLAERKRKFDEQLEALRHREIDRLLHMLDAQPETGLKYALPIGADGLHRGQGEAGARLVQRPTDFSLSRLGGGGPVDVWDLGDEYRARLQAKYRELANREIALGHHRRAAYIFAELLGDLRAAAATLADGRLFREAAALYDQRLKDSRAAAHCLEQGGLLSEAIVFYQGMGDFEKVAELYEKLQQPDFAAQAYRRAVDVKLERADYLAAAQLLETKLRLPDEAHATLMQGWPDSAQARLCLDESFHLLAGQAAHECASTQLRKLTDAHDRSPHSVALAACFSRLATHYPEANVRLAAADHTRVLASHRLDLQVPEERTPLLEAVRQLAPQDRLLLRDCSRFQQRETKKPSRVVAPKDKIRVEREFSLPQGEWRTAIALERSFYAAGYPYGNMNNEIMLVRGLWSGTLHQPGGKPWRVKREIEDAILIAGASGVGSRLFVHPIFRPPVENAQEFPETDHFWRRTAGNHAAFDVWVAAINVSHSKQLDVLKLQGDLVLETYDLESGQFLGTSIMDSNGLQFANEWHPKLLRVGTLRLTHDFDQLLAISPNGAHPKKVPLSGQIHDIASSSELQFERFAAATDLGIAYWSGHPFESNRMVMTEGMYLKICFLGSGLLIAANRNGIEAYDTEGPSPRFLASRPGPGITPIALLPLPNSSQVALITNTGRVIVYSFG